MSGFKDAKFVKEFAFRTMWNYYGQKERFAETDEEKMKIHDQRIKLLSQISASGYEVDTEYFEVTDLLNSLIGLLIFPEQAVFKEMKSDDRKLEKVLPTLYKCTCRNDYISTYHRKANEGEIGSVIQHIKNSLSHDRVMILPQNSAHGDERCIEYITFQDACVYAWEKWKNGQLYFLSTNKPPFKSDPTELIDVRNKEKWQKLKDNEELCIFSITIPVEDLETVIFEIAKFLISKAQ